MATGLYLAVSVDGVLQLVHSAESANVEFSLLARRAVVQESAVLHYNVEV